MRLFVAVELSPAVVAEAARIVDLLRARVTALTARARVTWVTAERMHLTVRFIGQADEIAANAVRASLAAPIAVAPFEIAVAGTGAFPVRGAPRVIWAGIAAGQDDLAAVEREVTARLASVGIAPEDRPYAPHLTLGRVKDPAGLRTAALLDRVEAHDFGTARVDAITLFESRLSPKGPTYVPLARTPLRAG